jgi:RNA recognition motif-containing protein
MPRPEVLSPEEEEELRPYLQDVPEFHEPPFYPDFSTAVVVQNLPKVPEDKFEKLKNVIMKKVLEPLGQIRRFEMPLDPATQQTLGFAFVNYGSREQADAAVAAANGYKLDARHIIQVSGRVAGLLRLLVMRDRDFDSWIAL